jgi:hypothetical protein
MASCPSCRRPVAVARETCVYCGSPLPPADSERGSPPEPPGAPEGAPGPAGEEGAPPPDAGRTLVVLDLAGASAPALAEAVGWSVYEARLAARRGGFLLHRVLGAVEARAEAQRLLACGVASFLIPEAEVRVRPLRALGGERGEGVLTVRTEERPVELRRGDLMLVVRGPITREYQPSARRRRVDTARLDEGYRLHLYRHAGPREGVPAGDELRPVEIDTATFELGAVAKGSSRIEIELWVEAICGSAPWDDAFRRLPPALGPAEPEPKGALAIASSLRLSTGSQGREKSERPMILDNVQQFRFYSGWRAAVERRRLRS